MEIGDKVIVYDHEMDGSTSRAANPRLGLVNGPVADNGAVQVVTFPGNAVVQQTLRPFDPTYPEYYVGQTYYSEGDPPDDFGIVFGYPNDAEWNRLIAKQRAEYEVGGRSPEQDKELRQRHLAERKDLAQQLSKKYPKAKPAEPAHA